MKKSLSTILSLAMAFSMFSSVALAAEATKTSADFSDLKDLDAATKAKFDALISAGVFDGVKEGTFGLKDEMNRAQFAKVAALIFNLKVDTSLKASTFTDVKADDPANGYALPYIEAVKAAGITDGVAPGQFNPAGKVTKEQLAAFLVRGINKDADAKATPGVNDATVSDWAKGYVALALNLKLLSNGADGKFGGNSNATRDLLVLGASEAKAQYRPIFNGKYAISSLKATDANLLALQLNGAVTEEAAKTLKIEVKKDGNVVTNYTTTWSEDKTTATLTFDSKFQDNTYAVTISGVSNLDTTAATSSVTTTKEKIAKIEFLTASETLPRTVKDIRIDFKATNQYGAKTSLSANNFTINASSVTRKNISGEQAFYLTQPGKDAPNQTESKLDRNERVSVTIIHEESGVTANKVFAIGDIPNIAKIEVGDILDGSNNKVDAAEAEKDFYLGFKAFDQYGLPVEDRAMLNTGVTVYSTDGNVGKGTSATEYFVDNVIGTDAADLKLKFNKKEAKDNVSVSLIANGSGQTVTKTFKVTASKTPATVEFGAYTATLAESDTLATTTDNDLRKKFFVPIVVKDAKGDTLTAQEIVDNASKFTIYPTGNISLDNGANVLGGGADTTNYIVKTGEHKGKIAISAASGKGNAGITVQLIADTNVKSSWSTSVGEKRKADKIAFSLAPKKFMINQTNNEFKLKLYDQHGGELKTNLGTSVYEVKMTLKPNTALATGYTSYGVSVLSEDANNKALGETISISPRKYKLEPTTTTEAVYAQKADGSSAEYIPVADVFDKSFKFRTDQVAAVQLGASYTVEATLFETVAGSTRKEVGKVSQTVEVIDGGDDTKNKLTYEVYLDKGVNNTLLAVDDFFSGNIHSVGGATYTNSTYGRVVKEIKVRAKNSSGEEVKIPGTIISTSSSNQSVANVSTSAVNKLAGLDAGTAKISVLFKDAKGGTSSANLDVTTKNEAPVVASLAAAKAANTLTRASIGTGIFAWDAMLMEKLTVKDQYGNEYISEKGIVTNAATGVGTGSVKDNGGTTDMHIPAHKDILNLSYFISDVKDVNRATLAATLVSIDPKTGVITAVDASVKSFTLNVIAPSGLTVTSDISVN